MIAVRQSSPASRMVIHSESVGTGGMAEIVSKAMAGTVLLPLLV